ncbi:MAG: hypothetical protein IIC85_05175 [Chloroflexi bacterium]|nr:hypothetical protein [Chloroflexota bacterium]
MKYCRVAIFTLLLALAVAATAGSLGRVHANGRVLEFDRRAAGPFEIAVGKIPSTPSVGPLHLTMTVTETATGASIIGADVVVTGVGPDSTSVEIGPLEATSDLQDPTFYDVALQVDRIGIWVFTVVVEADLGKGTADFPIEVVESSPITGIVTIVAVVAFGLVLGLTVRLFLTERKKGRRRRT